MSLRLATVILLLSVGAVSAFGASFVSGKHDFTDGKGWDAWYPGHNPCTPCHTRHTANAPYKSPQWDPEYEEEVLPIYNAETLYAISGQMGSWTKLCLSCHDGTIGGEILTEEGSIHSHPVSVMYDRFLASTSPSRLSSPDAVGLPLYDGKIECPTCHDPHTSAGGLLRVPNDESRLCRVCHDM